MNEKKCFLLTCSLLASLISFGFVPVAHAQWVEEILIQDSLDGHWSNSTAVDIDGDIAVVLHASHQVSLFARSQGGLSRWDRIKTIMLPPVSLGQLAPRFRDVSLQGDFLLIGLPHGNCVWDEPGAAYLFARNEGGPDNWGLVKVFTISDVPDQCYYGFTVALSNEVAFIGKITYSRDGPGLVYVYGRHHGGTDNWGAVRTLTAPNLAKEFGIALAASNDQLLVGNPNIQRESSIRLPGEAFVFARHYGGPDNWGMVKQLLPSDSAPNDNFGEAVALDGNDALIGAPRATGTHAAYVFNRQQGGVDNWGQVKRIISSNRINLTSESVALDEDMALVGIGSRWTTASTVYRFSRNRFGPNNWGLVEKIRPNYHPSYINDFGQALAISKNAFVVGTREHGVDSLIVAYLYTLDPCGEVPPQVTQTFDEKYRVRFTFSSSIGIRSLDLLNPEQAKMTASEPEPDDMEIGPDGQLHIPFSGNPSSLDITLESTTSEKSLRFNLEVVDICDQITRIEWPEVSIKDLEQRPPASAVQLSAPYPNPFNPEARFTLSVPETQHVTVRVYDVLGRVVAHLHDGVITGNQTYTFRLDARNWASGTYLYQVSGDDFIESRTFVLAR